MYNRDELGQGILELFCEAQLLASQWNDKQIFVVIADRAIELADKRSCEAWRLKSATPEGRKEINSKRWEQRSARLKSDPVFLSKVRTRSKNCMRKARLDPAKRAADNAWQRAYRAKKKASNAVG